MNPYHPHCLHNCHAEIPEPSTWILLAIGMFILIAWFKTSKGNNDAN